MIVFLASILAGCTPEAASIKFDGASPVTVHTLDAVPVAKATVLDKDGNALAEQPTLTWSVSPAEVASLDGGNVKPAANGTAKVEASINAVKGAYDFVVALPDKVEIAGYAGPVGVGADAQLTGTVKAGDAAVDGQTVTWATNNETIATVDATGKVHGVAEGTATITATSGALSATLDVAVGAAVAATDAAPAQ